MTERERIALIDRLRALPTETEWFEFRRNRYEPQQFGEYLYATKAKGNQDRLPWLAAGLRPNTGIEPHVVAHPDDRVVLFEIGPANEVHNLLQELRRSGLIDNRGSRSKPQWVAVEPTPTEAAQ